jgi:hypothetical protein
MDIMDGLFEDGKPTPDESELVPDKTVFDGLEAINSLCIYRTWKGKPRDPSGVSIKASLEGWSATLVDYDNDRSVCVSGKTVEHALAFLDSLLCSGKVNWYYWKKVGKTTKKKAPLT